MEVVVREVPAPVVTVVGQPVSRVRVGLAPATSRVVKIREQGPRGEKGEPGVPGSGDLSYVHVQSVLSPLWRIEHGMGRIPNASFFDTAGTQWFPDVIHESTDVMLAKYGLVEVAGIAYLS